MFLFFQFDFRTNLEEIRDFLVTIQIYLQLPDYEDNICGTQLCSSVRLLIYEQGPHISWQKIASIRDNYQKVVEFLLPTGFYDLFRQIKIQLYYNEPRFNPFFTPIFHVVKVEAEGFMFYDSAEEYYRAYDLL